MSEPAPCAQCGEIHARCKAHNRAGRPCGRHPHPGATVCHNHGGAAPQVQAAAARRRHEITVAGRVGDMLAEFDVVDVDPLQGLLEVVGRTWAWVQVLGGLTGQLHPGRSAHDPAGPADAAGIYGANHLGDGAEHVLLAMYGQWLERHARACKLAIDAGIAERQVRLAEQTGALIAQVLRAVAKDVGLDLDDETTAASVARHLRLVEGGQTA